MNDLKILFAKLKRLARARSWRDFRYLLSVCFYDVEAARRDLQLMATGMIGETTVIHLQQPIVKDFSGQAYRDSRGVRSIDISPAIAAAGLDNFYITILHEIAHEIFHITKEERRPLESEIIHKTEGAFIERNSDDRAAYKSKPEEVEADSFAGQFDRRAHDMALAKFGNAEIKNRIRVLKNVHIQKEK